MDKKIQTDEAILNHAKQVFEIEIEGLQKLSQQLDLSFVALARKCVDILDNGGKIVISGVGKSGHIGKKIAATLASTGSPSVFMHPIEALHGDIGILQSKDILIALSYSGETDELLQIMPAAKRLDVPIASMTGFSNSRLGKLSDITVSVCVPREACPFNMAPTTSSTATLAMGDALAMVLLQLRGFSKEDFGRLHPGGSIGRAITLQVQDIMRKGDRLAIVSPEKTVKETLLAMTKARSGSAAIATEDNHLLGIFTDGDFRRHAENDLQLLTLPVKEVMTVNPITVSITSLVVETLKIFEKKHIDDIVVLDEHQKIAGIVDIQDLPGLKLL